MLFFLPLLLHKIRWIFSEAWLDSLIKAIHLSSLSYLTLHFTNRNTQSFLNEATPREFSQEIHETLTYMYIFHAIIIWRRKENLRSVSKPKRRSLLSAYRKNLWLYRKEQLKRNHLRRFLSLRLLRALHK